MSFLLESKSHCVQRLDLMQCTYSAKRPANPLHHSHHDPYPGSQLVYPRGVRRQALHLYKSRHLPVSVTFLLSFSLRDSFWGDKDVPATVRSVAIRKAARAASSTSANSIPFDTKACSAAPRRISVSIYLRYLISNRHSIPRANQDISMHHLHPKEK